MTATMTRQRTDRHSDAPNRAVIYCRISSDPFGTELGVERQEDTCRELCEREGWEVVRVFTDNDVSAFSGVIRPAYEAMLAFLAAGEADVMVAVHVDRLYRRVKELARLTDTLNRYSVAVRTVSAGSLDLSTASGRFTAQVLASAAEHESARIGERVSAKHKANARAGKAPGGIAPYGYTRTDKRLYIDPEEAAIVRECVERVLDGEPLNQIVIDLNDRDIPGPAGGPWRASGLNVVLRSGRIAGLSMSKKEVVAEAEWEGLIDRATWERVVARLTHAPVGRRPRTNLLAGFLWCAVCGSRMKGRPAGNGKYGARSYSCDKTEKGACGSNAVSATNVERIVVDLVLGAAATVNLHQVRAERSVSDTTRLAVEVSQDEQMLTDLSADMASRRISRAEWLTARDVIEARLKENRAALGSVGTVNLPDGFDGNLTPEVWDTLTFDQKRAVIGVFIDRVVIHKGKRGRMFDESRIRTSWRV